MENFDLKFSSSVNTDFILFDTNNKNFILSIGPYRSIIQLDSCLFFEHTK